MESFDFRGRAVFVAGGTSGINLGIAEAFARAGAKLAVVSRKPERVEAAKIRLQSLNAEAVGFSADVRNAEAILETLRGTHEAFGDIDVLVSGAAGNFSAPALGMSANGFKTVVDIDLLGSFNVLRAAHQFLRKPGACVVNISAPQAVVAMPFQAHVCAAKAGVDMLTRVLAIEWGGDGVRINSVIPGPIAETEGMARLAPDETSQKAVTRSVPLGRFGTKQDVANLVMFLASPLASYITGAVIPVDGGWSTAGVGGLASVMRS